MKKVFILAVLLSARTFALNCPSGFVELAEAGINNAVTGDPYTGQLTITRTYNDSSARGDQQTISITAGAIDKCIAGGNYTIRQRGSGSGLTIAPYWTVPSTGGPYTIPDIEGNMPVTPQTSVALSQVTGSDGVVAVSNGHGSIVAGTGTNCVLVNGTSGPCGSGSTPSGSNNQIVATPSDGSSGNAALRKLVPADIMDGISATGVALSTPCPDGALWRVTGSYNSPAVVPGPGLYHCNQNVWHRLMGSMGDNTTGIWDGSTQPTGENDDGSAFRFVNQSPSATLGTSLFVYPHAGRHDSTVQFGLRSTNDSSYGQAQFNIQKFGPGGHLYFETFATGSDLTEDSWRFGEYTQNSGASPAIPNQIDFQFCFGNTPPTGGQYCPYIIDKYGIFTRTIATAPSAPASGSGSTWLDSATKAFSAKNDAGALSVMAQPIACTNQVLTALSSAGLLNCHTLVPADVTPAISGTGLLRNGLSASELSGDATTSGSNAVTVKGANGVLYSGLVTGILKNTTTTGVPSIAVAGDFPTLNQSTSGNAATATALAANPTDCSAGQYANAIAANGNLTCAQVAYSQVTGTPSLATVATSGSASDISAGTLAAARGGAGTISGALKGNGSGVVSQAACGDLSNAAASCSTDTTNAANIGSGSLPSARLATAIRAGGFSVMFRGSDASAGTTLYLTIPYACTITDWVITGDSTATIKLWRVADGGTALPTVSNTLSASGFGLATGTRIHSTTLTDLSSTAIAAYDTFGVNLFASASTHVEFALGCQR